MVSPPYKGGFPSSIQGISEDGSQLWMGSLGTYSNPEDVSQVGGVYQAARTNIGWTSTPIDASIAQFIGYDVAAVSADFANSIWFAGPPSSTFDVYRAGLPHGPFARVGPGGPDGESVLGLVGASRDLSHTLFRVRAAGNLEQSSLWPGDQTIGPRQPSLYEYDGIGNEEPRLVGVSDEHAVSRIGESHLISDCATYLGSAAENTYNAISETGGTVFFTALGEDQSECGALGAGAVLPPVNELWARIDAAKSVAISEPSKADCGECKTSSPEDAEFQGASADGSDVFFTTTQHLLPDATGEGSDLYRYDFDAPATERVTLISAGDPAGARVQAVTRVSEDGSHVYFVAKGVLTPAANIYGAHAEEGAENLYVYERDTDHPGGHIAFIAPGGAGTAQATPDGRFLVFQSAADITPDQEARPEAGQVFEYDAQTSALVRVSQGQDGYDEDGNTSLYPATIPEQSYIQDLPTKQFTGLAVSEDGADVFFTSADALTSQAQTGDANVYEYRAGHVALISDGHDNVEVLRGPAVELIGTTESGRDVYFGTADSLVPQDGDTQVDLYDARVEGGFPAPATSALCSGDACQGALAGEPQPQTPPTAGSPGESPATPSGVTVKSSPKVLTRAQKLAAALTACRKKHGRRRAECDRRARRRYGRSK